MSNVGPDGVTNWNALRSDKEVINSFGGETRTSRKDGFERETTYYGGSGSTRFTSEMGSKVDISNDGKVGDVSINSGTKATLDQSIGRTLNYNYNQAVRETEQRQEQLVNSMANTISQMDKAGYTHAKSGGINYQKFENGSWGATGADGKTYMFSDTTKKVNGTTNKNSLDAKIDGSLGSNGFFGNANINGSVSTNLSNTTGFELSNISGDTTNIARGTNAAFGIGYAIGKSYSDQNSSDRSSELSANLQETSQKMDSYTKAVAKEETYQKAMNMSEDQKLALTQNIYTSILQNAYDEGDKPENGPKGGERGALRALSDLENDKYGAYVNDYLKNHDLYKDVKGFIDKTEDKIGSTDVNNNGLNEVNGSGNKDMIDERHNQNNLAIDETPANQAVTNSKDIKEWVKDNGVNVNRAKDVLISDKDKI
ncbi:hypothetical protein A9K75_09695 [Campylobacter fetus subsp. testudinum]|uniref:hypothetical protein n=1 Tax=Campylobacter fetus TaxID=196 RepID=UPI000818B062|nr:hypothetical protein [Campylobacter fetus]OCR98836.1 hypothetical protein A9K75_09695 [Campylobacter fetus subsp. testudinum]